MTDSISVALLLDRLASRWARLSAAMIDGMLGLIIIILAMKYLGVWDSAKDGVIPMHDMVKLTLVGWGSFFVLHGYLLKKYGQTIGKRVMGIAIVTLDGELPEFWPLIARRYVPMGVVGYIPYIGRFLSMVDSLFIFRKDKRCVHDLIAGTVVIKLNSKSSAQDRSGFSA
ncbi:MAG: hypothetical protein CENE_01864 [Candidatus Celerinatantimonas neptuna]|nr:MAG: hypothetical protein CENE_01864 [Candidatus Celerinatantimonas neptuna]